MKVLIVGDKPSPRMAKGAKPFEGAACEKRLKEWMTILGLTTKNCRIINQCNFTFEELVTLSIHNYSKIIALGENASNALGNIYHFKLPHPSFKNRKLNSKEYEKEQLELCKAWLNEKL